MTPTRQKLVTATGLAFLLMITATTCNAAGTQQDEDGDFRQLRAKLSALAAEGATDDILQVLEQTADIEVAQPSQFWEQIDACGFYPQESRLECVITIKQQSGYGGPVGAFGSFEHVLFCVDWNGNGAFDTSVTFGSTESVGSGNLHMHDQPPPAPQPPWHYAVYRDIDLPGGPRTTLDGGTTTTRTRAPTLSARAILSWLYAPRDCNYVPIWGTIFDFRIRVDPIR